jgi:inner membrane protein involved in colicin E2 resistance
MHFIEPLIQQILINDVIEMSLYAVGSVLSAILTALSISAYRKSGLKKLQYAVVGFSLFCGFLIYENLENLLGIDDPYTDIIIPSMALAILVSFFLAVIKKSVIDKKLFYNQ